MRIKTVAEMEQFRSLIGEQNFSGIERALTDGACVWIFLTEQEINDNQELLPEEKLGCLQILQKESLGYAGWVRPPVRRPMPWFEPVTTSSGYYDSHGNYHGGGGDNGGSRH